MSLYNIEDLLSFTNCSKKQLDFLAFGKNTQKNMLYKKYIIKKKSGKIRVLHEPTLKLKLIQRKILSQIIELYWENNVDNGIKKTTTWFCRWKNIVENASFHLGKKVILKFDLKNYFPSISQDRVFWMFHKRFWYNYIVSNYLAGLCTFENELPQWSPTSPLIANIISINLDIRIKAYVKKIKKEERIKINYSRYADDISISINSRDTYFIENISRRVFSIIEEEWFMVNYSKYRILKSNRQQKITWIIVNDKVSLWRSKLNELKAIVYNINRNWWIKEYKSWKDFWHKAKNLKHFQQIIRWKIAYFEMVNYEIYSRHLKLQR